MTTISNTTSVQVNAGPQEAFDYVSDLSKHGEWSGGPLRIEAVSGGAAGVGSTYYSVGGPNHKRNDLRVTRFEPPAVFAFVASDPQFGDVTHTFSFTAHGSGTLIARTVSATASPIQAFVFRYFLYPRRGRPVMEKAMAHLREHFEPGMR